MIYDVYNYNSCSGVRPVARLEDLLSGRLFESLREKQPNVVNKVVAIIGDITEPGLGISPQDEALLEEEVFHSSYFQSQKIF